MPVVTVDNHPRRSVTGSLMTVMVIDEGFLSLTVVPADPDEVCDGEDDDCDGTTDEGVLNAYW